MTTPFTKPEARRFLRKLTRKECDKDCRRFDMYKGIMPKAEQNFMVGGCSCGAEEHNIQVEAALCALETP